MKLVIAGSRTITDYDAIESALCNPSFEIEEVVSGCAPGADRLGEKWALNNGFPVRRFPADWKMHSRSAGPIRNEKMAQYGDAALVLWDGVSRGSRDMIQRMKRLNKPCTVILVRASA